MKKLHLVVCLFLVSVLLGGCINTNTEHVCDEHLSEWKTAEEIPCGSSGVEYIECKICHKELYTRKKYNNHDLYEINVVDPTCTENGYIDYGCNKCEYSYRYEINKTGHTEGEFQLLVEPTETTIGQRAIMCSTCGEPYKTYNYVNNGYFKHGKLSVNGADLVNQYGEKVQLYGLSTHGLQWFSKFACFETLAAIQSEFGNNIVRFALTTAEDGYCDGDDDRREQMLGALIRGIDAATKLGLYVIVDWHMVGAQSVADKNPLTYVNESIEFFSYISELYKDQDNILFEIMNEPNGSTTWADCKAYANQVIPAIRQHSDGIILVGNPRWTADLNSVMRDPLTGYENIMYTYHFYAADHRNTSQVVNAYASGFPVFISEFGFMYSDGDGSINTTSGENWKKVLDDRNISYVAWNISNSHCSASIFKEGTYDIEDVSNSNLKTWGIYLKNWYRSKSGLDK